MSDYNKDISNKPKKKNPLLILTIILTITTIVSIGLAIHILITSDKQEELPEEPVIETVDLTVTYSQEEVDTMVDEAYSEGSDAKETEIREYIIQNASQPNPSFAEFLRKFYYDKIVYLTDEGFEFVDIDNSYAKNDIVQENFTVEESGEYKYVVDGEVVSHLGIDVSEYQGNIDWKQVADYGVEFAIIRLGYRGYGSGKIVEDAKYERNLQGANDNGIETGVYFFTQAISIDEMQEEIDQILSQIDGYNITGPVVLDVEKLSSDSARGNDLSKEERTELALYFCEKIREQGYTPMIYGNTYTLFHMLDISQIHDEAIWFAFYNTYLYYPYDVKIWQYSDSMQIPGISGNVDIDIRFE